MGSPPAKPDEMVVINVVPCLPLKEGERGCTQ